MNKANLRVGLLTIAIVTTLPILIGATCDTTDPIAGLTVPVMSTFDATDESWQVVEGPFSGPTRPKYQGEGGSPGGAISASGPGPWYWEAPPAYLGNKSLFFGRQIQFDLNQSNSGGCEDVTSLIIIQNRDLKIFIDARFVPGKTWTNFSVKLDESAGWLEEESRKPATAAQIRAVLLNVTSFRIRGWFYNCGIDGEGGLDNVAFGSEDSAVPPLEGTEITSTFDLNSEGWAVADGEFDREGNLEWDAEGGATDGHVNATGRSSWYWLAPPKFRGNAERAYGHYLKFDLNQSNQSGCENSTKLVVLNGGGLSIYYDATYIPAKAWTSYSVQLQETELWFNSADNKRITGSEMRAVLSDLRQIKIRGWYYECGILGTGGLDNVILQLTEPTASPLSGQVVSQFENGAEDWIVAGGEFDRLGVVTSSPDAGSPGGHISAEGRDDWYWIAPPKYYGDASGAYGRTLSFDLNVSYDGGCENDEGFVFLDGGGYSIVLRTPSVPAKSWTGYSILLSETELWQHVGSGQRVTRAELQRLLADLSKIRIRGWFFFCGISGVGGLDNVVLDAR